MVSQSFFDFLRANLSQVMGPVAMVMMDEELKVMGETVDKLSNERALDLVVFLSRHIPREEKKLAFLNTMLNKFKS